jgi:1,2-diacylglycerol 3-alpha-glucosyltransferase
MEPGPPREYPSFCASPVETRSGSTEAKNNLRIGFFTNSYLPTINGVTRAVQNLREGLEALGHTTYVVVLKKPGYTDVEPRVLRVPSAPLGFKGDRLMLPSRAIAAQLRKLRLDIVHSHGLLSTGLMADYFASAAGVPHVHTVHTNFPSLAQHYKVRLLFAAAVGSMIYPTYYRVTGRPPYRCYPTGEYSQYGIIGKSIWRLAMLFSAHADAIIAPAGAMSNRLHDAGLATPIYSIPNSADRNVPTEQDRSEVKAWLRSYPKNSSVRILYVGRVGPEKRVDQVIEALALVPANIPAIFLVVGDGADGHRIRRMVHQMGLTERVLFAGRRGRGFVSAAMEEADFLVLPSYRFDTQPLAIVEATLAHLPILYCDDLLKEGLGSGNALLVQPTVSGLREGIVTLALDAERLTQMAYLSKDAATEFSAETVATRTIDVYRQAIDSTCSARGMR